MNVLDVALLFASALERAGVPYFLGGSMATSLQGEPRATNDLDFVADLREDQVAGLVAALGSDFELDADALRAAIARRGSWNAYYLPLVTKVDLFCKGASPFDESEFSRRRRVTVRAGREIFLKSPEDSILRKLLWFRQGGEVSAHQLRDASQVLLTNRASIDRAYLDHWAGDLGLTDLLLRVERVP